MHKKAKKCIGRTNISESRDKKEEISQLFNMQQCRSDIQDNIQALFPDLVTKPVLLTSIFLNKQLEKKDGSLQTSLVIVVKAAHKPQKGIRNIVSDKRYKVNILKSNTLSICCAKKGMSNSFDPDLTVEVLLDGQHIFD